jgi:hypothetical protein
MVLHMKVWVVVYNYGLINEDVGIFSTLEDARRGFKEYTGICMLQPMKFTHGAFSLRLSLDKNIVLSLRLEWTPERKWKEIGYKQYSEYYEQCDIFEGEID